MTTTRESDTGTHPAAVERKAQARLRLYVGIGAATLCGVAFLVALWRDNNIMLVGSFLGIMVAGNVIPFSEVKSLIPTWGPKP